MIALSQPLFRGPDPIQAIVDGPESTVLAVIAGTQGPAYRPVGTTMAVMSQGWRTGSLSSGCIEADIARQAMSALETGALKCLRYGRGSPFRDIELPCGGGLDILLIPKPDRAALRQVSARRKRRQGCTLEINCVDGSMRCLHAGPTAREGDVLRVRFEPALRFVIFGKGPEASTFTALVQAGGYSNVLLSPDEETRQSAAMLGSKTEPLRAPALPESIEIDERTAISLFFHDHDWEPPILSKALESPAFYIGAQGSQRARDLRNQALLAMGVERAALGRIHGPVGLIPSARDPGTLAVSVLAEILAKAQAPWS
ncbi:MAG: XdhC family protein [Pseudomonadota bacterium]